MYKAIASIGVPLNFLPLWEKIPDPGKGYYSQYGQDMWVLERVFPGRSKPGFFIEMGASDGICLSNTFVLEKIHNWKGILVEPTHKFLQLEKNRTVCCVQCCISEDEDSVYIAEIPGPGYVKEDPENTLRSMTVKADSLEAAKVRVLQEFPPELRGKVGAEKVVVKEAKVMTMERLLDLCNAPRVIDYLSLDVEGYEYEIMKGFPFDKYTILAMNIERPNDDLKTLLEDNEYLPVAENTCGDIFYINECIRGSYFSSKP